MKRKLFLFLILSLILAVSTAAFALEDAETVQDEGSEANNGYSGAISFTIPERHAGQVRAILEENPQYDGPWNHIEVDSAHRSYGFYTSMGCDDITCSDPAHTHWCPEDICQDASHNHSAEEYEAAAAYYLRRTCYEQAASIENMPLC